MLDIMVEKITIIDSLKTELAEKDKRLIEAEADINALNSLFCKLMVENEKLVVKVATLLSRLEAPLVEDKEVEG